MRRISVKKTLILLAGFPGTGKTYLSHMIQKQVPFLEIVSPDDLKEEMWDQYGFDNLEQKNELIMLAWEKYYKTLEEFFSSKVNVLSDYPFSNKQKEKLEKLCLDYEYQIITIRLIADLEVLFERQKKRDLDLTRHLGHIVKQYHKEDHLIKHDTADNLLDHTEFMNRMLNRGYDKFTLGHLIEVDVTDFTKVDYDQIIKKIQSLL